MAKELHEITPAEFEAALGDQLPRGLNDEEAELPKQRWAYSSQLAHPNWQYRQGAFFLGYRNGDAVGRVDDRHIVLVAGSRAGKTVSILGPNCLTWPGSLLVIDPKGELANLTAGYRTKPKQGSPAQRVHILNPFPTDASRFDGTPLEASFNPLDEIDVTADDVVEKAGLIADALIVQSGDDTHWADAARRLVHGVILHVLTLPKEDRHLVTVRKLLRMTDDAVTPEGGGSSDRPLFRLLADCEGFADDELNELVSGIGQSLLATPDKERGSILSSAVTQTAFLDSPKLHRILTRSTFRLRDLKRDRVTVYLCLPATYIGTHSRWLRIVLNMALQAMEDRTIPVPSPPVLFVMDEFGTALGYMASIEKAAGLIAGYGVRLVTVLQDLTQLQHHYKATWETFIGNAGLFITFGNSDQTTLKYISEKLGSISVPVVSQGEKTLNAAMAGATGASTSLQTVPLLAPFELEAALARERGRLLVAFPGMRPIILQRAIWQHDKHFKSAMGL